MSDNLQETICENPKAPVKASGDAGSVEQHKLMEQIAANSLGWSLLSEKIASVLRLKGVWLLQFFV